MKNLLLCGVAALVLVACTDKPKQANPETKEALGKMSLLQSGDGRTDFGSTSIDGDEVVFNDVFIRTSELAKDQVEELADENITVEVDLDSSDLKARKMTFKGLDVDGTGKVVFKKLSLADVQSVEDGEAVEGSTVDELSLTNPTPELAAWVAGILGKGEAVDAPDAEAVGFDHFVLSGLKGAPSEEDPTEVTIGKFEVDNYRDFKAGKINLSDLGVTFHEDGDGTSGVLSLENFSIEGSKLDFLKSIGSDHEADALKDLMASNPVDPGFNALNLKGLKLDTQGLVVDLPSMSYAVTRDKSGVPVAFNMPKFTMTMNANSEGGEMGAMAAPWLAMLNLDAVNLTMEGKSTYDPKADTSTSDTSYVQVDNAFKLSTTGKIGGIKAMGESMKAMDPEAFADGEQDLTELSMDMYSKLDIHNFKIQVEDQGIVDKVFGLLAAQRGETPDKVREETLVYVSGLPFLAAMMGIDSGIAVELSGAAQSFISEGGTLTIELNPEAPLSFGSLMADPTGITKDSLGFSATATK